MCVISQEDASRKALCPHFMNVSCLGSLTSGEPSDNNCPLATPDCEFRRSQLESQLARVSSNTNQDFCLLVLQETPEGNFYEGHLEVVTVSVSFIENDIP